ncbi:MAG: PhoH family protein [Patescibacteria group bacterium]
MTKIFILDTNVLLHDPKALSAFGDNEIVLPLVVLDELDKKKVGSDEVARHARMVIRTLDDLRTKGNIHEGVQLSNGGILKVELGYYDKCPMGLDPSRADNRLIGIALGIKEHHNDRKVIMITKDINLRVKCDALGVRSEDYNADSVAENPNMIYDGTKDIEIADETLLDQFHKDGFLPFDNNSYGFFPNQYICIKSAISKKSGLARVEDNNLVKVKTVGDIWGICSRNKEQAFALDALFNPEIKLVTLIGRAGTGKTLLAAAAGIAQLFDTHSYKKLIMTRPIQPMGKDLGYLPGDIDEKMRPWMAPLQDNLELLFSDKGANFLDMQREAGLIEVEALTYIRGRSIPKSFIIIDEAQNLTSHEIKTIITRAGEGSKIVLTGDIFQIDNTYIDSVDNGLSCIVEKFKGYNISAHVTLKKGERSVLATLASEIL